MHMPADLTIRNLEAKIPGLLLDAQIPGLSLAFIRDAKMVWAKGFGVKSLTSQAPMTVDTVFEAASISKPVAAYAALMLCENGLMDLDTPLIAYLPDPYYPADPNIEKITARHALTHTSGFPNGLPELIPRMQTGKYIGPTDARLTHFMPGTRFAYSGEGFYLLQMAIAQVTGQAFEDYTKTHLLDPLGMARSSYIWLDKYEDLMADAHNEDGMARSGMTWAPLRAWAVAAASLNTTPTEYARFLCALLQDTPEETRLLSSRTTNEMLTAQFSVTDEISWGMGWGIQHHEDGTESFWHHGHGAFTTFAIGVKAQQTGLVMMANGWDDAAAERVFYTIIQTALGGDHPAFDFMDYDDMKKKGYVIK